jgi:MFS superfamily sulfate permease-like transporter
MTSQGKYFEYRRDLLAKDFVASVVVFLVALPLCMGIAIASGVPPAAGLITGIVGGLIVGLISGAPLQVSGPAAGLTVLVWQLVQKHGLEVLGATVALAGAMQLIAGVLRLGQWFRAISPAVIQGMLAGIGVLIFASQFHIMVDDKPRGSGLANLLSIPQAIYKGVVPMDGSSHHIAAAIGLLTIIVIVAWTNFAPNRLKLLPGALIGAALATAAAAAMRLPIQYVNVPESLMGAIRLPSTDVLARVLTPDLLISAFALAFIASAETLLCATAVDQMHTGPRANYDRELRAQGVGNLLCGALGALPMTGVIVRSSANVDSGARTRLSAMLHGAWLLAAIVAAPALLRSIPTAALAAILVYTGYKLAAPSKLRALARAGRGELAICLATMVAIVVTDLLTGVLIGFGLAIAKLVSTFSHLEIEVQHTGKRYDMRLRGAATFLRLPKLAAAIESVPLDAELHLHLEGLEYIDHACMELIATARNLREKAGAVLAVEFDQLEQRFRRRITGPGGGTSAGRALSNA